MRLTKPATLLSLINGPHLSCRRLIKSMLSLGHQLIFGVLALCACNISAAESSERELQITAAYLYHFVQFTEWLNKPSVFHYCVYENTDFADLLRQTYSNKMIGEAHIDVTNINENIKLDDCHLIYFAQTVPVNFLQKISKYAILSVSAQKNFTESGGIIYLFEDNQKLRFYINNTVATEAGLKISSQLLKLSREP